MTRPERMLSLRKLSSIRVLMKFTVRTTSVNHAATLAATPLIKATFASIPGVVKICCAVANCEEKSTIVEGHEKVKITD